VRLFLGLVYVVLLGIWSWLLVKANPVPESLLDGFSWFDKAMLHFVLAKTLHLSVYAGFAVLGGWLAGSRRLWLWTALVLHGVASEVGQMIGSIHFDTHRHGCVRDMLIDAAGITAGAYLLRFLTRRYPRLILWA
jgi:hypothetical protein